MFKEIKNSIFVMYILYSCSSSVVHGQGQLGHFHQVGTASQARQEAPGPKLKTRANTVQTRAIPGTSPLPLLTPLPRCSPIQGQPLPVGCMKVLLDGDVCS